MTDKEFKLYGEVLQMIENFWIDMQNKNFKWQLKNPFLSYREYLITTFSSLV